MPNISPNRDQEVTISEQGNLAIQSDLISPAVSGTNSSTFTVPTGKKWVLKSIDIHGVSLSATVSYLLVRYMDGSDSIDLLRDDTGGSTLYQMVGSENLILQAGKSIRLITQLSAFTSGDISHEILVQELDA